VVVPDTPGAAPGLLHGHTLEESGT